jgi:Ser/Thr protein kinase RdoA (MazF antagonist)
MKIEDYQKIKKRWALTAVPIEIRNVQNRVFTAEFKNRKAVLRAASLVHRSETEIEGELAWMAHLARNGIPVSLPIPSRNGSLVEQSTIGGAKYNIVLFEYAPGEPVGSIEEIDDEVARNMGRLMGRMHQLGRDFECKQRTQINLVETGISALPFQAAQLPDEKKLDAITELVDWLDALPKDGEHYGLIHGDFNSSNFHREKTTLYPFDFDDCCCSWFAADLALALYSHYFDVTSSGLDFEIYERFKRGLIEGYMDEMPGFISQIASIDRFIGIRIALLYCWMHNRERIPNWIQTCDSKWRQRCIDWSTEHVQRSVF